MPAINFASGFLQGADTTDRMFARHRSLDQRDEAMAEARRRGEIADENMGRRTAVAERNIDLAEQNAEDQRTRNNRADARADSQEARAVSAENRAVSAQERQARIDSETRLKGMAAAEFEKVLNGGQMNIELVDQLEEAGLSHFTIPYWIDDTNLQNNLALRDVLAEVGQGNFNNVNTPETLSLIQAVYGDQLEAGVGEQSMSTGKPIMRKSLAGLRAAPNGAGVVALLNIEYADGTTDQQPVTLNRSSDPNDPVAISDLGEMLDDVAGRVRLASIFSQDEVQEMLRAGNNRLFGTPGQGEESTAQIRNIEYLTANGMDRQQATRLVMYAKTNPGTEIGRLFNTLADNNPYGSKGQTNDELYSEAVRLYQQYQTEIEGGMGSGGGGQFPDADVKAVMDSNPGWDKGKAVRYLQHLQDRGEY